MDNFNKESILLTKKISKQDKKNYGMFFTPYSLCRLALDKVFTHLGKNAENCMSFFLEPSVGSG